MKLDSKTKRIVKKDKFSTCGYIHSDGVVVKYEETHTYKGEVYRKEKTSIIKEDIPISFTNYRLKEKFAGRLVVHNPTLLLDGIKNIAIYRNNASEKMKEMGITCDTVTITTLSGLQCHENIFSFVSSDIVIQNNGTSFSVDDWTE